MVRFHTLAFGLTCVAACGSSASTPKVGGNDPPTPIVAQVPIDAAIDAPSPPKLVCDGDATPVGAVAPDPTWHCTRADGTRHGPFVTLFPDGSIEIRGAYEDGLLAGAWQRHHHTGGVIEDGTYVAGQKHGTWRQLSPAGAPLGSYEMAAGTGVEKRWYEDGPLYSETAYRSGVLHGWRKVFTRDGHVIESARYQKGKLDGPHAFGTHRSMRFEETFVAGVRRGTRKIFLQTSLIADETYDRLGRLDGPFVAWRSTKIKRVEGKYAGGKRHGVWEWNDRDGKKEREGEYSYGRRHGDWLEWTDEKLTWTGQYSYGKPHGTFTYYAKTGNEVGHYDIYGGTGWALEFHGNGKPSVRQRLVGGVENGPYQVLTRAGKVLVSGNFAAGVKHGAWKTQTEDGVTTLEQPWTRGKLDGLVKKYVDGKLAMEAQYVAGIAHGKYAEYRAGKPAVTGEMTNDRKSGTWTHYNADGAVVRVATYKAGILDGPYRELADGAVIEGNMVAGRRSGAWTRTDKAGNVRKLTYGAP